MRLTDDEIAFYDALDNGGAVEALVDQTLREIAKELARTVRNNLKIDWTVGENAVGLDSRAN